MCSYDFREHYKIVSTECQTSNESIGEIQKKTFPKWFEQNLTTTTTTTPSVGPTFAGSGEIQL